MAPGDETRPSTTRRNLPRWRATLCRGREFGTTRRSASLHSRRVCRFRPQGRVLHTPPRAASAAGTGNVGQLTNLGKTRYPCAGASKSTQKALRTVWTYPGTSEGPFVAPAPACRAPAPAACRRWGEPAGAWMPSRARNEGFRGDLRPGVSRPVQGGVRGSCAGNPVERPGFQAPAGRGRPPSHRLTHHPTGRPFPAGWSFPAVESFPAARPFPAGGSETAGESETAGGGRDRAPRRAAALPRLCDIAFAAAAQPRRNRSGWSPRRQGKSRNPGGRTWPPRRRRPRWHGHPVRVPACRRQAGGPACLSRRS